MGSPGCGWPSGDRSLPMAQNPADPQDSASPASGMGLGLVVSSIYFTRLVLGPIVGRIGDRRGYRGLLIAGTLLYVPIGLAYAAANNVFTLAGARALHGVGSAIVLPMVMAVMGQHAGGKSGATMARYNAAQWLGYAVGPLA